MQSAVYDLETIPKDGLPIVISNGSLYLEVDHTARPELQQRLAAVVDAPQAVFYKGWDTTDQLLMAVRPFAPVHVYDYSAFASNHRDFYLYCDGGDGDWWLNRLTAEHNHLLLIRAAGGKIYRVSLNPSP